MMGILNVVLPQASDVWALLSLVLGRAVLSVPRQPWGCEGKAPTLRVLCCYAVMLSDLGV